jgi:hypothetical protein
MSLNIILTYTLLIATASVVIWFFGKLVSSVK